jgi:aldose 1-epimerase
MQEDPHPNFGATVGRVAGRIANASFRLNGQTYQMTPNNGPNLLHSE